MAGLTDGAVIKENLQKIFGYKNFRSVQQEQATQIVFKGKNDVYLNLQPGEGKSLCFQLPTVMKANTVTLVFVPTHILAKNQILFLRRNSLKADFFTRRKKKGCQHRMRCFQSMISSAGLEQFLYVVANKRSVNLIKNYIIQLKIKNMLSYIVFDEAHCVSSLSHNYVPAYQDLAKLVNETCPDICKIAITSTATTEVRRDIISKLNMKNVIKLRSVAYNKTVYHDVYFIDTIPKPLEHLTEFIDKALQSKKGLSEANRNCGLIFCRKIEVAKSITEKLTNLKISVVTYHGDLKIRERDRIHKEWTDGEISVLVTIREFGIGLHKPNVRFVVHWDLPLSLQQLYQESERISQYEKKAYCRVYYSYNEEQNIMRFIKSLSREQPSERVDYVARKLQFFGDVVNYCLQIKCRHVTRWQFFGQIVPECRNYCDACGDVSGLRSRITEFLEYRASMKKAFADKLALIEVIPTFEQVNNKPEAKVKKRKTSDTDRRTQLRRKLSYNRFFHELMKNYNKTRKEIERDVRVSDVANIARCLENSLFTGSHSRKKYNHDVVQTVFGIRRSTASGIACGYLKYFEAKEKLIFNPHPKDVVDLMEIDDDDDDEDNNEIVSQKEPAIDDRVMKVDLEITATKVPELVDLASDTTSETETP